MVKTQNQCLVIFKIISKKSHWQNAIGKFLSVIDDWTDGAFSWIGGKIAKGICLVLNGVGWALMKVPGAGWLKEKCGQLMTAMMAELQRLPRRSAIFWMLLAGVCQVALGAVTKFGSLVSVCYRFFVFYYGTFLTSIVVGRRCKSFFEIINKAWIFFGTISIFCPYNYKTLKWTKNILSLILT